MYGDGSLYNGDHKDDQRHGVGTYTFLNGDQFSGDFANGVPTGSGIMIHANGQIFAGDYANFKRHGYGLMTINGSAPNVSDDGNMGSESGFVQRCTDASDKAKEAAAEARRHADEQWCKGGSSAVLAEMAVTAAEKAATQARGACSKAFGLALECRPDYINSSAT
ncbi:hypothetical protein GPECTOR_46g204 [Gonium pectorale]|uniref:Uncharacterized protein n=1 Tax=Gonium pectorale TaxID=33097 RepID=A0A150G9A1_GONPE|nr:hypothetical protein GPECTOR_46g204 [Gonium pectorale]|eukprot:KXZ46135.1 hypothetical protein GPECTOR_46g204 [Gonium pectorale]